MSISCNGLGNCGQLYFPMEPQGRAQRLKDGLQQVGRDLQSGDLEKAKMDYSAFVQAGASRVRGGSSVGGDIRDLGTVLEAGDLGAAQKAFETLQGDLDQVAKRELSRHHHQGVDQSGNPGWNGQVGRANPLAQSIRALGAALQSGDLDAAQQAFDNLRKYLQGSGGASQDSGAVNGTTQNPSQGSIQDASSSIQYLQITQTTVTHISVMA